MAHWIVKAEGFDSYVESIESDRGCDGCDKPGHKTESGAYRCLIHFCNREAKIWRMCAEDARAKLAQAKSLKRCKGAKISITVIRDPKA